MQATVSVVVVSTFAWKRCFVGLIHDLHQPNLLYNQWTLKYTFIFCRLCRFHHLASDPILHLVLFFISSADQSELFLVPWKMVVQHQTYHFSTNMASIVIHMHAQNQSISGQSPKLIWRNSWVIASANEN